MEVPKGIINQQSGCVVETSAEIRETEGEEEKGVTKGMKLLQ